MTIPPTASLYFGRVMHQRLRPFGHRFVYRVFSLYLDIDRIAESAARTRLFSYNRFNLYSFHDRDHGGRDGQPLRPWVEAEIAARGEPVPGGRIMLLCFPRLFGYVFNPLSIFFCYDRADRLAAILYEVRNTFGDKHSYVIPVEPGQDMATPIRQSVDKHFYVSPFIDMEAHYRFRIEEPGERLAIVIRQSVPEGDLLVATQHGRRAPLDDKRLLRAFLGYPLMSLKVIAAIHWEALRLWLKGAKFHSRPATEPSRPDSTGRPGTAGSGPTG